MSLRLMSAVAASLALAVAPMGVSAAMAQTSAPTAASLQAVISTAARAAAADPAFASLSPQGKLAAIQAAVSKALAATGASPAMIQAALIQAVGAGVISAGVALAVAQTVAPEMVAAMAANPIIQAQLAATGQTATVTGATDGANGVSVLVSLQGATPGGAGGTNAPAAPYDPCAGVVAAYCGG